MDNNFSRQSFSEPKVFALLPFKQTAPDLSISIACFVFLFNFIFGGVGTIIAGFQVQTSANFVPLLVMGCVQTITAYWYVGWVWGVWFALYVLLKACKNNN